MHRSVIRNSNIISTNEIVKTTECSKFHSAKIKNGYFIIFKNVQNILPCWPHDDNKRSWKTFSKNHCCIIEIKLHVAFCVSIIFHHFRNILNITTKIYDSIARTFIFIVVRTSNQWRTENYIICSIWVSFDSLKWWDLLRD